MAQPDPLPLRFTTGVTLLGGAPCSAATLTLARARAPVLVAADGGFNTAHALGQKVAHVIGDMDSRDPALPLAGAQLHPLPEQETTDLDKCLYSLEAPFFLGAGFLGGRLDHELAAMHALVRAPSQTVVLLGEGDLCFLVPETLSLTLPEGTRLSLFPMGTVRGESEGLQYPLSGTFAPATRIGTSNTVTGPVRLRFDRRRMLCILPLAHLDAVLAGLGQAAHFT